MTRNERIAERMGWIYLPLGDCMRIDKYSYVFDFRQFVMPEDWWPIKKLQARMVEDGWTVRIEHWKENGIHYFDALAVNSNAEWMGLPDRQTTEPAAIVSLFCKVYGITEEA
jgi:hypothetical protein